MKQKTSCTGKPRKQKPWHKTIRGQVIPPTRVENPKRGGKYDHNKWQKEAQKQKSSISDLTLLELLYFLNTPTTINIFENSAHIV